jgi:hypothetical protein
MQTGSSVDGSLEPGGSSPTQRYRFCRDPISQVHSNHSDNHHDRLDHGDNQRHAKRQLECLHADDMPTSLDVLREPLERSARDSISQGVMRITLFNFLFDIHYRRGHQPITLLRWEQRASRISAHFRVFDL